MEKQEGNEEKISQVGKIKKHEKDFLKRINKAEK